MKFFILGIAWIVLAASPAFARSPVSGVSLAQLDTLSHPRAAFSDRDEWISPDKFDHLLLSAMLSSSGYLQLKVAHNAEDMALVSCLGFTLGLGVGKELYDIIHPGHPSWKDLAADAAGALLGALVAGILISE